MSEFNLPLDNLFTRANKHCIEQMKNKNFITALAVQFDCQSAKAWTVRASHLALYYVFGQNGKVQKILPRGAILVYLSESRFLENVLEKIIDIQNGDVFVVISDDIFELQNQIDWNNSKMKLINILESKHKKTAKEITEEIFINFVNFTLQSELFDDITTLVIKAKDDGTTVRT